MHSRRVLRAPEPSPRATALATGKVAQSGSRPFQRRCVWTLPAASRGFCSGVLAGTRLTRSGRRCSSGTKPGVSPATDAAAPRCLDSFRKRHRLSARSRLLLSLLKERPRRWRAPNRCLCSIDDGGPVSRHFRGSCESGHLGMISCGPWGSSGYRWRRPAVAPRSSCRARGM